jgi:hypothetical protein
MSNPYTTQTITGYNQSPPADDGSQVSTNEIKWSNHKTKLGDPIKTLSEAINTELLSAFALTFGQTISAHSGDYTVVAGDRGKFLSVTGTTTITLLAVATAGEGFPLVVVNTGTGVVTVDGNGAETINGDATVTLNPGNSIILNTNGTSWTGGIGLGDQSIKTAGVASAVNEVTITNAATTVNPTIQSTGEANTGLILADSNSNEIAILESTASAVNEITITNAAIGNGPNISATGTDTNIDITLTPKGTGAVVSGSTISGYVSGVTEYVEGDTGTDSTTFDVGAVIGAAWESVGPTGSGATNIWTAMDIIPAGAKWVELGIRNGIFRPTSASVFCTVYGRVTGSSTSIGVSSTISLSGTRATGATTVENRTYNTKKIPVDSNLSFDLYLDNGSGTPDIIIALVGWGI